MLFLREPVWDLQQGLTPEWLGIVHSLLDGKSVKVPISLLRHIGKYIAYAGDLRAIKEESDEDKHYLSTGVGQRVNMDIGLTTPQLFAIIKEDASRLLIHVETLVKDKCCNADNMKDIDDTHDLLGKTIRLDGVDYQIDYNFAIKQMRLLSQGQQPTENVVDPTKVIAEINNRIKRNTADWNALINWIKNTWDLLVVVTKDFDKKYDITVRTFATDGNQIIEVKRNHDIVLRLTKKEAEHIELFVPKQNRGGPGRYVPGSNERLFKDVSNAIVNAVAPDRPKTSEDD